MNKNINLKHKNNFIIVTILILGILFLILYNIYPQKITTKITTEGYRVDLNIDSANNHPINIYRNNKLIKTIAKSGNYLLEYLPPGKYQYHIKTNNKNLLGITKKLSNIKSFEIFKITDKDLNKYFNLPEFSFSTQNYNVYISTENINKDDTIKVYRDKDLKLEFSEYNLPLKAPSMLIEQIEPGNYIYEVEYNNLKFKNLSGLLKQKYSIQVESIKPKIESLYISPLSKGYSLNSTAIIKDTNKCEAKLFLYPPENFNQNNKTLLKEYSFNVVEKLDKNYFSKHSKNWKWEEILFPTKTDIDTSHYQLELQFKCFDYYNSTTTEQIYTVQTGKELQPNSSNIYYAIDQNDQINAHITNATWLNLNCQLNIADQENNIIDKQEFLLEGRHEHLININEYNRNLLYLTLFCNSEDKQTITKISEYKNQ